MKKLKKILTSVLILISGFLVLKYANLTIVGVKKGLDLSFNTIIPSLFIFMIIAEFLSNTDLLTIMFFPLRFISFIMRVPPETVSVFIMGILGGYPTGAQMVANLVKSKKISPKLGEILICSTINCSPSFIIGAVGIAIFNNVKIGLIIYLCEVFSALIIGIIMGFFIRKNEDYMWHDVTDDFDENISYSQVLVNSVISAGKSLFMICSFILLFSVIFVFLNKIGLNFIGGFLEVCIGCASISDLSFKNALILSTIYTSFGGICVLMQIKCFLSKTDIKMKKFIISRIFYTAISVFSTLLSVKFLKIPNEVFATTDLITPSNSTTSFISSAFVILLCVMLLISNKKYDIIN